MRYRKIIIVAVVSIVGLASIYGSTVYMKRNQGDSFTLWQLPGQARGQMMSYVIQTKSGRVLVVDGGREIDAGYLADFLERLGAKVSAWFITHPHNDHVGALGQLLMENRRIEIARIYGSIPKRKWIKTHEREQLDDFDFLIKAVAGSGKKISELETGQSIDIDGVTVRVVSVHNPELIRNAVNNSSVVLRFSDEWKSVLFLGDLGRQGGRKILRGPQRKWLPSDYVQMAHHGQNGVSKSFYKAVRPKYCLWPTPRWLWENDNGGGNNSGPWDTLRVRGWMENLGVKEHFLAADGLVKIQ